MTLQLWLAAVLFVSILPAGPTSELTIAANPDLAIEPANIWVLIQVEPHPANSAVEVVADSGEFYRSSRVQLDGARSARVIEIELHDVPRGEYEVHGVVTDASGRERASACAFVTVLSSRGTPPVRTSGGSRAPRVP